MPLSEKQYINANNEIIQLYQTFECDLISDVNNTPNTNTPMLEDPSRN